MTEPHIRVAAKALTTMLKLLRDGSLTREQLIFGSNLPRWTVDRWLDVLVEDGIVRKTAGFKAPSTSGPAAYRYHLAPEWKGPA